VQEFKYLGFNLNKKGDYKRHIVEINRKEKMVARKVWDLGEKLCRNDFSKRWMLYLVQNVMAYGVELWGRKGELEKN